MGVNNFSEKESLELIARMINSKNGMNEGKWNQFIVWGLFTVVK